MVHAPADEGSCNGGIVHGPDVDLAACAVETIHDLLRKYMVFDVQVKVVLEQLLEQFFGELLVEAAGIASTLSLRQECDYAAVSVDTLQKMLRETGQKLA